MKYKRGHNYPGLLISFDGRDGCGKSTQCKKLSAYLKREGYQVIETREPGGTEIGNKIRQILLEYDTETIEAYTELLLFQASRSHLVSNVIIPSLKVGKIVCLDRFFDSTIAYQGAGGVQLDLIFSSNRLSSHGISPDRTYIFDADAKTIAPRLGKTPDRIESKNRDYHERVKNAFLGISNLEPERIKLIDGSKPIEEIHQQVIQDFSELVGFFDYKK